jgi:two-component system chemotaxis sensor kinase CheA
MAEPIITEAFRQELVAVFVVEAEEMLEKFEQLLLELEQRPDSEELLNEIFRVAHTLKGNAACLQFEEMTQFAHVVEALLEKMRDGKVDAGSGRINRLLDAVDALRAIATRSVAGSGVLTIEEEALLAALDRQAATNSPALLEKQAGTSVIHSQTSARTLRVATSKFDRMLDLAGEIAVARGQLWKALAAQNCDEHTFDALREVDRLSFDLQEAIMNVRLVPVGPAFRHFHRVVRDVAATQDKQVRLVLSGEDVEVDNTVIEHLKDPITHMVRNAIDHGVELPAARVAAGKAAMATISIAASHEAGSIVISFSDDGAGLDAVRIGDRARNMGLNPERMSRAELWNLIFEPGFSTASTVTDLSGRGVGMDVVRRNIESLGGTIAIESHEGSGTTFTIRLPLTLAVIEAFGVSAGDERYVVPMDDVLECVELPGDHDLTARTGILFLRGEVVPYVRLRRFVDPRPLPRDAQAKRENVLIVRNQGQRAGLVVDALHGASQAVIKPLGFYFSDIPGVAGSSILGDGRVALILDTTTIFRGLAEEVAAEGSAA